MKRYFVAWRAFLLLINRVMTNTILGTLTKKRLQQTYRASGRLRNRNEKLQDNFNDVFRRYDLCERCVSHCCHSPVNRFDFVDSYITGQPLGAGVSPWHRVTHLGESVADMVRQVGDSSTGKAPEETCIHHSESVGCTLPVGERPSMCITGVCWDFMRALSEEDLKEYKDLLVEHGRHRRTCTGAFINDLRKPPCSGGSADSDS